MIAVPPQKIVRILEKHGDFSLIKRFGNILLIVKCYQGNNAEPKQVIYSSHSQSYVKSIWGYICTNDIEALTDFGVSIK